MDIHGLFHPGSVKWSHSSNKDSEWADLDGFSTHHNHIRLGKNNAVEIIWDMFEGPVLLVVVGIMSALVSCLCNIVIDFGNSIRFSLLSLMPDYTHWFLFCLWSLFFSLFACFATSTLCQESAGSGLPEMKAILSGVIKPVLLSIRMIFAKMLGLICSIIAGLSVGKEGPFVQISGAIADQLMKLSIFKHIHTQDSKRLEIIACACASGVAATFGTAFGGVIFSIELTASAYLVRTIPKAFLSSVCAMLTIYYLDITDQLAVFSEDVVAHSKIATWQEMMSFLVLGIISGLLGVLFVTIVENISKLRNSMLDLAKYSRSTIYFRRYAMVACVAILVSVPCYYEQVKVQSVSNGSKTLLDFLFQANEMHSYVSHFIPYFAYKFIATALSVTLPLPVGLFTPVFLSGGVLGRIFGELLCNNSNFKNFFPWEYAILGAAGFATGVTRAISTAIIVYELSGQPHMRLPLAVVVLTSYFVGNRFSKNVYEALIDTNGTPYMQEIPKHMYNIPISKVMIPLNQQHVLALDSTYEEANNLLNLIDESEWNKKSVKLNIEVTSNSDGATANYHNCVVSQMASTSTLSVNQPVMHGRENHYLKHYSPTVIPIVKSKKSMVIVGAVRREDLSRSICCLKDILTVSRRTPIVLGSLHEHDSERELLPIDKTGDSTLQGREFQDHAKHTSFTSDPMMKETIQYVVLADGGKTVIPVASRDSTSSKFSWNSFSLAVILDPSPYQIVDTMQLSKVDLLFRMLSLSQAYVTNSGKLVGFVTRSALREYLGKYHRRPMDKCKQLSKAIWSTISCSHQEYNPIPDSDGIA